MDFFETIKKRRTIRNYEWKKIPFSSIKKIILAGGMAPSAMNKQPWRIVVIDDPKVKESIRKIYENARKELNYYEQDTSFITNGTLILVCSESHDKAMEYSCAMAAENMLLAATALGLGSGVSIAIFQSEKGEKAMRKLLKIPEAYCPMLLLTVGAEKKGEIKHKPKEVKLTIHKNKFGRNG
ncbi:MAG: nitroreductase family protein [Candidatus Gracilibacteria bacterium]|jgi:nitroreductase